ncbi:MAG: tRNA uridine-5-carboxymethylaminomethyl(34) synthesis GTPase MnmE [Legionellales bacterium]
MLKDTIVALATPPGRGGVGIIRISGSKAYTIATHLNGSKELQPRLASFSSFYNYEHELLDQGLMLYFKAPHSFTGEDVVELQAHGSPVVLDLLLKECLRLGARLAMPGEFSERAFLNNKIDLTQAEAIADLIQASSQTAARMALKSLQGDFSNKINQLNDEILKLRIFVEAAIDFPEEEIDFLTDGKVTQLLQLLLNQLDAIRAQASQGVLMREGLSLIIVGRPNAGKSTLINSLVGKDIAIVTEVAGTTRDLMKEHVLLDDLPLHIIDTAGLRDSEDVVEKEGIKRAWQALERADCVLLVIDVNHQEQQNSLIKEIQAVLATDIPIITVVNKIDTLGLSSKREQQTVLLSAKEGDGLDTLKKVIKEAVGYQPNEGQFLARRRHLQALDDAKNLLLIGQQQLTEHRAGELLAEDLRLAHRSLCEITGEITSDDLLGKIFSSFCIGK